MPFKPLVSTLPTSHSPQQQNRWLACSHHSPSSHLLWRLFISAWARDIRPARLLPLRTPRAALHFTRTRARLFCPRTAAAGMLARHCGPGGVRRGRFSLWAACNRHPAFRITGFFCATLKHYPPAKAPLPGAADMPGCAVHRLQGWTFLPALRTQHWLLRIFWFCRSRFRLTYAI